MAANERTVKVGIGFRDGVTKAYRRVKNAIGRDNREIRKSMNLAQEASKKLSNSLKSVGAAVVGFFAFRKVNSLLKESIALFDTQAKAEAQLANALGYTSDKLIQQAKDLQKLTEYGDEATIRAQALIGAFVKEEDQIARVIPLVQDLAAAKGMDLAGAADLVSKTLGSSTNALSRYGIQVEGAVGSTERLESLTKGLDYAFGGTARTLAEVGAGPLNQLQNRLGDIKELLGKAFVPLVIKTTTELEAFFTAGEKGDKLEERFRKLAISAEIVVGAFKDTFNTISGFFKMAAAGIMGWTGNITGAFYSMLNTVNEIIKALPDRLIPDGWALSLKITEEKIKTFAEQSKKARDDLYKEGIADWEKTGQAAEAWKKFGEEAKKAGDKVQKATGRKPGAAPSPMAQAGMENEIKAAKQLQEQLNLISLEAVAGREAAEIQALQNRLDQEKAILEKAGADKALFEETAEQRLQAIQDKYRDERIQKDKDSAQASKAILQSEMAARKQGLSNLVSNLGEVAAKTKEFGAIYKAAAITQTVIDTIAGAQAAFKSMAGIPIVGPALGGAAAAAAIAAGFARVATIKAQKFQSGGFVQQGPMTGDKVPVLANRGELILNAAQQRNILALANGGQKLGTSLNIGDINITVNGSQDGEYTAGLIGDTIQERLDGFARTQSEVAALAI